MLGSGFRGLRFVHLKRVNKDEVPLIGYPVEGSYPVVFSLPSSGIVSSFGGYLVRQVFRRSQVLSNFIRFPMSSQVYLSHFLLPSFFSYLFLYDHSSLLTGRLLVGSFCYSYGPSLRPLRSLHLLSETSSQRRSVVGEWDKKD